MDGCLSSTRRYVYTVCMICVSCIPVFRSVWMCGQGTSARKDSTLTGARTHTCGGSCMETGGRTLFSLRSGWFWFVLSRHAPGEEVHAHMRTPDRNVGYQDHVLVCLQCVVTEFRSKSRPRGHNSTRQCFKRMCVLSTTRHHEP